MLRSYNAGFAEMSSVQKRAYLTQNPQVLDIINTLTRAGANEGARAVFEANPVMVDALGVAGSHENMFLIVRGFNNPVQTMIILT